MTQEEKQLLLIDLCARLPYGVKVQYTMGDGTHLDCEVDMVSIASKCVGIFELGTTKVVWRAIEYIKPYLRPMSSMTEEEVHNIFNIMYPNLQIMGYEIESRAIRLRATDYKCATDYNKKTYYNIVLFFDKIYSLEQFDWLNAHHFDYRGLIPMGLALEAPEEMYKTE